MSHNEISFTIALFVLQNVDFQLCLISPTHTGGKLLMLFVHRFCLVHDRVYSLICSLINEVLRVIEENHHAYLAHIRLCVGRAFASTCTFWWSWNIGRRDCTRHHIVVRARRHKRAPRAQSMLPRLREL